MGECLLSRRDRQIVARHEYVFSALLNRPGRPVVLRTRSYRTLRDGSFEGRFPGTSCQATIGVVPPGRAGRHFATASS